MPEYQDKSSTIPQPSRPRARCQIKREVLNTPPDAVTPLTLRCKVLKEPGPPAKEPSASAHLELIPAIELLSETILTRKVRRPQEFQGPGSKQRPSKPPLHFATKQEFFVFPPDELQAMQFLSLLLPKCPYPVSQEWLSMKGRIRSTRSFRPPET